eukprot:GILK01010128.1.p1 GENE.GILK01010128.1~~GILK01010128.1.p1  ORF type:complete len:352 (-),score=29.01 GILK01010128.1:290-1345(-)
MTLRSLCCAVAVRRFSSHAAANAAVHIPVLPIETTSHLIGNVAPTVEGKKFYVDGTLGAGGHTELILQAESNAFVLGIDRDVQALERTRSRLEKYGDRVAYQHGSYSAIKSYLKRCGFPPQVHGIVLDLGLSSDQLSEPSRGFSFRLGGPLDMRFDQTDSLSTAASILNESPQDELETMLQKYAEEKHFRRIADLIVRKRTEVPFSTVDQLQRLLEAAFRRETADQRRSIVTRCFQALRIATNNELSHLESFLRIMPDCLLPGGRMCVISFHSLEDRPVKHRFKELQFSTPPLLRVLTKRPITASESEMAENSRSKSAKLRVAQRLQLGEPVKPPRYPLGHRKTTKEDSDD